MSGKYDAWAEGTRAYWPDATDEELRVRWSKLAYWDAQRAPQTRSSEWWGSLIEAHQRGRRRSPSAVVRSEYEAGYEAAQSEAEDAAIRWGATGIVAGVVLLLVLQYSGFVA